MYGREPFFGFKLHSALSAKYGAPVAFTVTPGHRSDSPQFRALLKSLSAASIQFEVAIADAGYDARDNYVVTINRKAIPIIAYNRRSKPKGTTGRKFDGGTSSPTELEAEGGEEAKLYFSANFHGSRMTLIPVQFQTAVKNPPQASVAERAEQIIGMVGQMGGTSTWPTVRENLGFHLTAHQAHSSSRRLEKEDSKHSEIRRPQQ